ncbi:hypothetical protein TIFTF001_033766 [Ficus carica]|uniref:Uncharacterized protein n=1 Tax=Ficus carica TaxID=3494 RepID=A0AA88DYT3_FICCA|nr:hypothetical protein TIFTF001_033766 [Ficus carica]
MKPPEFEGSTDPLEAEEWLTFLQVILNFMDLTKQEKEFNEKFYNHMAMKVQQNEFNNIKRILDIFSPKIAVVTDSGERQPTTVAEYVGKALRTEYHLAQAKQEKAKIFEENKKDKLQSQ